MIGSRKHSKIEKKKTNLNFTTEEQSGDQDDLSFYNQDNAVPHIVEHMF